MSIKLMTFDKFVAKSDKATTTESLAMMRRAIHVTAKDSEQKDFEDTLRRCTNSEDKVSHEAWRCQDAYQDKNLRSAVFRISNAGERK
jgi:hypothetical protein